MLTPARRSVFALAGAAFLAAACASAPITNAALDVTDHAATGVVARVEPPNWWTGFEERALQLMIYGENVGALEPQVSYPGVSINRIERVASPNYLFVYLDIGRRARPGTFDVVFTRDGAFADVAPYTLEERRPGSAEREGFNATDVIYLITADRFANGDPTIDAVEGYAQGVDRADDYGRHGGDLRGLRDHLDYIADMGFTQIWLNPILENAQPEQSYHGYAQTDLYRVDPRYGSNADYVALAAEARARGIGLIQDLVPNHIGSGHRWMADLPTPDWVNHGGEFVETTHQRSALQSPYSAAIDRAAITEGWFVSAMPDLNQRNPLLADYLIQNSIWWVERADLSGFRIDTYPYSDIGFLADWMDRLHREYPRFNTTGEEWVTNPKMVAYWQRARDVAPDGPVSRSMMDFPLQDALRRGLTEPDNWGSGLIVLYDMLGNDPLYANPFELTIFTDNHDMDRVHTQMGRDADLTRMAFAWLLTMRGIPHTYYGDEVLMANDKPGDHGQIRSEFPGGWPDHAANAFTSEGLDDQAAQTQAFVRALANWRKTASAIHDGALMQFAPMVRGDDVSPLQHLYVYFRYDDAQKVMVVLNKGGATDLDLDRYAEVLAGHTTARDVITGETHALADGLSVAARSATVFEIE